MRLGAITKECQEKGIKVNAISKLSVISGDRKLKALYVSTIQEMVMAYCIETVG